MTLLERVHGSLRLDVMGIRYIAGVRHLIQAHAFALYVFDPETRRPTRVAQVGGVEPFMTRYEQIAFAYDPVLARIDQTLQPAHDALLFSARDWQAHELRQALAARRLMHMLIAPVVVEQERIGSLFFTRRPDAEPFSDTDLAVAGILGRHLGIAVRNALLLREAREQTKTAQGVLEVMGSALILTDTDGRLRFANRAAERLLKAPSLSAVVFETVLRDNLSTLTDGTREAVQRVDLGSGPRRLVVRSRRLPEVDGRVATFLSQQIVDSDESRFSHLLGLLSPREIEVLELLEQGLSNKEMARRLTVSVNTVQYHLKRLFALMEVQSRGELLAKARE